MNREIHILNRYGSYVTSSFVFPGGELQVRIPDLPRDVEGGITVTARLQSSDDLVRLLLTTNILDSHHHSGRRRLVIPYFPYARQDRLMQPGEAFSLKAVARIINGLEFDEVIICDPHSDVAPALLDRVRVISQLELIKTHQALACMIRDKAPFIIAPDAGAAKKAYEVAKHHGLSLLTATKVRDVTTGEITGTRVDDFSYFRQPLPCLIVDDICDGGRTFIELAKVLKQRGAGEVYLYVTHGIFSKGLGVFDGLIDAIYTTNSFLPDQALAETGVPIHVSGINVPVLNAISNQGETSHAS